MPKARPSLSALRAPFCEATISEQAGVRYLHLGTPWIQGAMRLKQPHTLELEYIQRMMIWLLWRPLAEWRESSAVQLGLGAGALTRFCHKKLAMKTTAIEINPSVIAACRAWFHLPWDDEQLQIIQADAYETIQQPDWQKAVAALCVDLYDHEAAAPVLDDEAFYAACYACLAEHGVMTVNLFGRRASFAQSLTRIEQSFGTHVKALKPTREGNTIVIAWKNAAVPDREVAMTRAALIEQTLGLPAKKWVKLLGS